MIQKYGKLIVIVGPTASGKTELAIKLAKKFNGEIISADSRQIYRGLNIGTAKPTKQEQETVRHHLIDVKNPDQSYTLWQYKKDAVKKIREIIKESKIPFLTGGTGLYVKAIVDNLAIPKASPDQKLRQRLENYAKTKGLKNLYDKLIKLDPEAAYIVDAKNPRRIIRALEIALKNKKSFSRQRKTGKPLFDILQIGLNPGKKILRDKIEKRVDEMLKQGLIEEVKKLIGEFDKNLATFDAIGYREIIEHLEGKFVLEDAIQKIKINTWRYAKRQMTWFKKDKRVNWIKSGQEAEKLVKEFLAAPC